MAFTAQITSWVNAVQFRAPTAGQLATYNAQLAAGTSAQAVQTSIINEGFTQSNVNPVIRLYQAAFNRMPDQGGLNGWADTLAASTSATYAPTYQSIAAGFANAQEFQTIYGATASSAPTQSLITQFYTNILQRSPSAQEVNGWMTSGKNVGQILADFAYSQEFIDKSTPLANTFSQAEINGTLPSNPYTPLWAFGGTTTINLTTGADNVNVTTVNTTVAGDQTTFQQIDTINGNNMSGAKLAITDTGAAAWNLPAANVSGMPTVSLTNINGKPQSTDQGTLSFTNVASGGTIIINGLIMTATGGTATAAQIAQAFATGATVGNAAIGGANAGLWTLSQGPAQNQISFISTSTNTAVAPIAVAGTAQAGQNQATNYVVTTKAGASAITFTYNGVTVTTAVAADNISGAATVIKNAINAYAGQNIASLAQTNVANDTVLISAPSPVSLAGFAGGTLAGTYSLTAPYVAGSTVTVSETAGSAGVSYLDTVNADNFGASMTEFVSANSSGAVTINNVNAGTAVTQQGNGGANTVAGGVTNGALTASFDAGNSTITANLKGGTRGAAAVTLTSAAATDLTTLNINSTGGTNIVGAIAANGNATAVNIAAATAMQTTGLTVGTNAANQVLTISGAATDRVADAVNGPISAVNLGTLDADFDSISAAGLTAGGVQAQLNNVSATFTGGGGNDIITTNGAQLAAVNAGSGSADVLVQNATGDIATTTTGALFTGFDILRLNNAVETDSDNYTASTITAIQMNDGAGATKALDLNATQAANITFIAGDGAATLALKDATGTADVMNITVSNLNTTASETVVVAGNWTIANVETINITAFDDMTLASTANITGLQNLNVSGAGDVSITTGAMAAASGLAVNFSGITSAATTFNFAGVTGNALRFTGSNGVDTVTDSVIGGNVINTGGDRDALTLTAKTGGTAADSITLGALGDTININLAYGNSANQKIVLNFANGDSIADGGVAGTGYSATVMDAVNNLDLANAAGAGAGNYITFDTAQSATAFTFTQNAVVFGTTGVTNAYDFLVYDTGAGGINYVYQDTNGNRTIDGGDFGIRLVGVAATAVTATEFTVTNGNLILSTL